MTYPNFAAKWRDPSLHGPEQFIEGARAAGWDPGPIPSGAIFVFDHRARTQVERMEAAAEAPELAPGNARVFRVGEGIVSCLSPGAGAMVTQMHNLTYLGCRRFVIAGTAGSISPATPPGATVVVTRAVRDDGISQHYLPPARYVEASSGLTDELRRRLPDAIAAPTWTMPIPYRVTATELEAYAAEGVVAVEMEAASLFAAAEALGVEAAAVLVITTLTTTTSREEDWPAATDPLHRAVEATVRLL